MASRYPGNLLHYRLAFSSALWDVRVVKRTLVSLVVFACVARFFCLAAQAEQHRATRLGNPATRFAPPLTTPEDLRSRFRDGGLRPDIASVLHQWGWTGKLEDLVRAALTAEVREVSIPVGTTMPFMSSREDGKPICLRNVLWAGKEPAPAYAFEFSSNQQRYRCVTPKACSNFYLEDLGPVPVPALAIDCVAPREALPGRPIDLCLTVRNPGTGPVPRAAVRLFLPPGVSVVSATGAGAASAAEANWEIANLSPKAAQKLCVRLSAAAPGVLAFSSTASATHVKTAQSSCSTTIIGIPAILIDAVDLEDPVEVGNQVTYEIRVTNQGSPRATNVKLLFILPPGQEYVSGGGPTDIRKTKDSISTDPLPVLASKDVALWRVVVKATQPGDVRFKIELTSDQFTNPIHEEESTHLY
jgi:uncharacterized repeat protein (TIGR01451 family)